MLTVSCPEGDLFLKDFLLYASLICRWSAFSRSVQLSDWRCRHTISMLCTATSRTHLMTLCCVEAKAAHTDIARRVFCLLSHSIRFSWITLFSPLFLSVKIVFVFVFCSLIQLVRGDWGGDWSWLSALLRIIMRLILRVVTKRVLFNMLRQKKCLCVSFASGKESDGNCTAVWNTYFPNTFFVALRTSAVFMFIAYLVLYCYSHCRYHSWAVFQKLVRAEVNYAQQLLSHSTPYQI